MIIQGDAKISRESSTETYVRGTIFGLSGTGKTGYLLFQAWAQKKPEINSDHLLFDRYGV